MTVYDAIIVEENISSLMTACLLQYNGIKTLIFENTKSEITKVLESLYYWDPDKGALGIALKKLGIESTFIGQKVKYTDKLILEDISLMRDTDVEIYMEKLVNLFPDNKEEITQLFNDMRLVSEEWLRLLDAGSVFTAGSLKQMMKFKNVSFADYLDRTISNERLKELLMLDCDKKNAAFVVISGYVFSQVMDGYIVGDVSEVYSLLKDFFVKEGGEIMVDSHLTQITKEDDRYLINDDKDNVFCSELIVSPYTERIFKKNYFGDTFDEGNNIGTQYVVIDIESVCSASCGFCVREKTYCVFENVKCILNVLRTQDRVVIKINCEDELYVNHRLVKHICKVCGIERHKHVDIYDNERLEQEIGLWAQDIQGWEFDSKQMQQNVMEIESSSKGLYTLGEWGCAHFTAAICVANTIVKRRNSK